ncbi:protein of unknown function [Magnetospirillum gryphiswaldense MSR-1 v2]|uniref:Uncharacterized protein n=1 Tax=Magnetospirillum gryphiswaldense (strain DSM 6361 / JCM 21280 / NBRC 15271 / MSR-1) TaxID=431944 RepID=V6F4W8_MAGGM|nr:protein of unknown function [Magnetospirillum gryphiswaldense MSR-1 v2]
MGVFPHCKKFIVAQEPKRKHNQDRDCGHCSDKISELKSHEAPLGQADDNPEFVTLNRED